MLADVSSTPRRLVPDLWLAKPASGDDEAVDEFLDAGEPE